MRTACAAFWASNSAARRFSSSRRMAALYLPLFPERDAETQHNLRGTQIIVTCVGAVLKTNRDFRPTLLARDVGGGFSHF